MLTCWQLFSSVHSGASPLDVGSREQGEAGAVRAEGRQAGGEHSALLHLVVLLRTGYCGELLFYWLRQRASTSFETECLSHALVGAFAPSISTQVHGMVDSCCPMQRWKHRCVISGGTMHSSKGKQRVAGSSTLPDRCATPRRNRVCAVCRCPHVRPDRASRQPAARRFQPCTGAAAAPADSNSINSFRSFPP